MLSVSKQNCITHCIISELVIEKTNEKLLNLPHVPKGSPSQPKSLTFASRILSLFEQIKQNPSDPLFSIASTEKEK